MAGYIPRQGDYIALSFDPQSGHEQKGRRPALVVSKHLFNKKCGLAFVCPVTNTIRGIPLHVPLPEHGKLSGVVMTEQLKSVDYHARKASLIGRAPADLLEEVLAVIDAIIYDD